MGERVLWCDGCRDYAPHGHAATCTGCGDDCWAACGAWRCERCGTARWGTALAIRLAGACRCEGGALPLVGVPLPPGG